MLCMRSVKRGKHPQHIIEGLRGVPQAEAQRIAGRPFLISSPQQLAAVLYGDLGLPVPADRGNRCPPAVSPTLVRPAAGAARTSLTCSDPLQITGGVLFCSNPGRSRPYTAQAMSSDFCGQLLPST